MRRVVLLNPPARRQVARDYFLSAESEPEVLLPPIDLAVLSGALGDGDEARVVDCVAEGLSEPRALERVEAEKPDAVVFLAAGATFESDGRFLGALESRLPEADFIGVGDLYRDIEDKAFALQPFLDAALVDFSGDELPDVLSHRAGLLPNVLRRAGATVERGPRRHRYGEWTPKAPRWDLFALSRYRWPFSQGPKRASILTEYGCQYVCSYCPGSALGHRSRPVDSVVAEWKALAALGVRDVFVRDLTFGGDRARTLRLLGALEKSGATMRWVATTRVDVADTELLSRMSAAGCVAVQLGIDSGDDEILRAYKKGTTRAQAAAAVDRVKNAGLKAWGTFVLGLSMDTRESVERTIDFAGELPLDWVSWRADNQRYAADYRRELLVRGLVPPEAMPPDTPTSISTWHGRLGLSNQDTFKYLESAGRAR